MKQSETISTRACFVTAEHKFKVFENKMLKEIVIFGWNFLSYIGSLCEERVEENIWTEHGGHSGSMTDIAY